MKNENFNFNINESTNRFELNIADSVAFIEYKLSDNILFLIHTEVPTSLEGKGVGSAIVSKTLEYAKENGYKIVPFCPFVKTYLKRHPEWDDIIYHHS